MDLSKLRQRIYQLNREQNKLFKKVMRPREMIQGSLYQMARTCGNPNCKCARGEKHLSWYLSKKIERSTKLTYIGRIVPDWIEKRVKRYQHHQRILARIRKIDVEISDMLNKIRDNMVQTIEEVKKRKG